MHRQAFFPIHACLLGTMYGFWALWLVLYSTKTPTQKTIIIFFFFKKKETNGDALPNKTVHRKGFRPRGCTEIEICMAAKEDHVSSVPVQYASVETAGWGKQATVRTCETQTANACTFKRSLELAPKDSNGQGVLQHQRRYSFRQAYLEQCAFVGKLLIGFFSSIASRLNSA